MLCAVRSEWKWNGTRVNIAETLEMVDGDDDDELLLVVHVIEFERGRCIVVGRIVVTETGCVVRTQSAFCIPRT